MEAIGLGLAVLAEVRMTVKSLQERISRFKEEEYLVTDASAALARVKDLSETSTSVMATNQTAILADFLCAFNATSESIKKSLTVASNKLEHILSLGSFDKAACSSGVMRAGAKARQFMRANSITKGLLEVKITANIAADRLQHQLSQLSSAVKSDRMKGNIRGMIERNRFHILAELRTTAKSIQDRLSSLKEEKADVAEAGNTLINVKELSDHITSVMVAEPKAIPKVFVSAFNTTSENIAESLTVARNNLEDFLSQQSIESMDDSIDRTVVVRAGMDTNCLLEVLEAARRAENMLHHQFTRLCSAVRCDHMEENLRKAIERTHVHVESYRVAFNAPSLAPNVLRVLDFEAKDEGGHFLTPEGELRHCVFVSTDARSVSDARGASSVHGVLGMAGVGKTTSLIGLGHDLKIRTLFVDGVLFFSLGASATEESVSHELSKIVELTGAVSKAADVAAASTLSDAASLAGLWFHGKRVLFLIDDVWPAPGRPQGYLREMSSLLQGNPESRIVLSTRSTEIAMETGSYIDFCTRDPEGHVSVSIFMSHAMPDTAQICENHVEAARRIIHRCAGAPIALSVTGKAIAASVKIGLPFRRACKIYFEQLSNAMHSGRTVLDAAISLSLSSLEDCAEQDGTLNTPYSLREMYLSLCVLQNQQKARVSVLRRMWKVDESIALTICSRFSSMSLSKLSAAEDGEEDEECYLGIHDLHLDYARRAAGEKGAEWLRRSEEAIKADSYGRRINLIRQSDAANRRRRAAYMKWLESKLEALDLNGRNAQDICLIKNGLESVSPECAVDPDQCQFQLSGRLTGLGGCSGLLHQILEEQSSFMPLPCFVPLWQTFESPASHLRQTLGTNQKVNCVAANGDGSLIAIGAVSSGVVQIWNLQASRLEDTIALRRAIDILDVAWLHGSHAVVIGTTCAGAYACVWGQNAEKLDCPHFALGGNSDDSDSVTAVAVSSTVLPASTCELIATGHGTKHLRIFNAENLTCLARSECHSDDITDLTWISRPGRAGRGSLGLLSASKDRTIVLSDTAGVLLHRFTGHSTRVNSVVSLAPKYSDMFASCGNDQKLIIWSITFEKKEEEEILTNSVVSLEIIPDTCQLVLRSKTNQLLLYEVNERTIRTLVERPHSGATYRLAIAKRSEGARVLTASSEDHDCKVWDVDGVCDGVVPNHHFERKPVDSVSFVLPKYDSSEDHSALRSDLPVAMSTGARPRGITCSKLGFICSWDLDSGERSDVYSPPQHAEELAQRESNTTPPRSPSAGASSRRRDSSGGGNRRDFICTSAPIQGGSEFVTGGISGDLHIWSLDDAGHVSHVKELGRVSGPVFCVGPIEHERFFLVSASGSAAGEAQEGAEALEGKNSEEDTWSSVRLWERGDENRSEDILGFKAKQFVFSVSDCGKYMLVGTNGVLGICVVSKQSFKWRWQVKRGTKVSILAVTGTERDAGIVRVVAAMENRKIEVYDVDSKGRFEHRTTLCVPGRPGNRTHFLPLNEALSFVPGTQGEWLVSGAKDKYLRLWKTSKSDEQEMSRLQSSPRGSRDISEGAFSNLISESEAKERRGDSIVAVYLEAEVLSCRCFADGKKVLVLVGVKDGRVINVRLDLPPADLGV